MARIEFDGVLAMNPDTGGAFVEVPREIDVKAVFGRARPAVQVAIGEFGYRSTLAVYGGTTFVGVNRAHRTAANVEPGDTIHVVVESDLAVREVAVPADLAAALGEWPDAGARFTTMSHSHRLEYARWIEGAKRPETRARRVAAAVERIRDGKAAG